MNKQILRFLSPALTILGLFTILLVLSSHTEESCCSNYEDDIVGSAEIYYFNKDSLPIFIRTNRGLLQEIQPQATSSYREEVTFNTYAILSFGALRNSQKLDEAFITTTWDKCKKLPILVVWDGTHLKVAQ